MKKITLIILSAIISAIGCSTPSESSEMVEQKAISPVKTLTYTGYEIYKRDFKKTDTGFIFHMIVATENPIDMKDTVFQRIIIDSSKKQWESMNIHHDYYNFIGVNDSTVKDMKIYYTVALSTK